MSFDPTSSSPRPRPPSTRNRRDRGASPPRSRARCQTFTEKAAPEVAERFKQREGATTEFPRAVFTQEMKDAGYTILCPQMAPIHFDLLMGIFQRNGYNLELLPSVDHGAVDAGLKYVNNDICYPSVLVTGQIMEAVMSAATVPTSWRSSSRRQSGGCRARTISRLSARRWPRWGCRIFPSSRCRSRIWARATPASR
ncbi:MAG: hypothetical protein ACLTMP_12890 [Eggerthella lenta]